MITMSRKGRTIQLHLSAGQKNAILKRFSRVLEDDEVDLIMITTRHDLHASMVVESLKAGKNVFVEKPLCLTEEELEEIKKLAADPRRLKQKVRREEGGKRRR